MQSGYEPFITPDWARLLYCIEKKEDGPFLLIIDDRICPVNSEFNFRDIRSSLNDSGSYVLLIATQGTRGQSFKPDDFLFFPVKPGELEARISLGMRIMELGRQLSERTIHLARATNKIKRLSGLLPICSYCKKIRDDKGYWNEVEKYISDHSDAKFSHGICPGCLQEYYPDVRDESS